MRVQVTQLLPERKYMLTRQTIHFDDDGSIVLRNTFDFSGAVNETERMNETGEWKGKDGYVLGNIPQEMFMYDPWLKAAARARREGDYGAYTDYMLRFFKTHSALACNLKRVNWSGWSVPILDKNTKAEKRPEVVDMLIKGAGA